MVFDESFNELKVNQHRIISDVTSPSRFSVVKMTENGLIIKHLKYGEMPFKIEFKCSTELWKQYN